VDPEGNPATAPIHPFWSEGLTETVTDQYPEDQLNKTEGETVHCG